MSVAADADIVIVGAGPAGLTLANLLASMGVGVILFERNPGTVNEPRAVSIDDESLRTLQSVGLVDTLRPHLLMGYGSRYQAPNGDMFAFVDPDTREYGFPRRSGFSQVFLETTLARGVQRFPCASLRFEHDVTAISQSASGVQVDGTTSDGRPFRARASYLIGCDGAKSTIRSLLDIQLEGATYREKWLIIDIAGTRDRYRHTQVFCDPRRPGITLPGPEGSRRFEFKLMPGEREEDVLQDEFVRKLMARVGPDRDAVIKRKTVYTFHARMAKKWREGRIFLAGDAAHLTPPFAGQGMNSGLRDVHNLAWKLAAVLSGRIGPGLLDTYQQERPKHAWELIQMAVRMGWVMMPSSGFSAFFTRMFFRTVGLIPSMKSYFAQMRYKPRPRLEEGFFLPDGLSSFRTRTGRLLPQPIVTTSDQKDVFLDEYFGHNFVLLIYSPHPEELHSRLSAECLRHLKVKIVHVLPSDTNFTEENPGTTVVRDAYGSLGNFFNGAIDRIVLVRPDRYVAAVFSIEEAADTLAKFDKMLADCGAQVRAEIFPADRDELEAAL